MNNGKTPLDAQAITPRHQHQESSAPEVHLPPPISIRRKMGGRNVQDALRSSSPLEALFDLTTVIAVAAAASCLHHDIAGGHYLQAMIDLGASFFTLWWGWMNFTWFSSAYDTDDIEYRLATVVQMIGMLIVAAGIEKGIDGQITATLGYTILRIALIVLWFRAARENPERRITCMRYATGLVVIQGLWLARFLLLSSSLALPSFFAMVVLELALPIWAEKAGHTPWHPHHMAERYSLFTIILLGECLLGAANAMKSMLDAGGWSFNFLLVSSSIVGVIAGLWWTYFLVPFAQVLHLRRERAFLWGYGHALVFIVLTALSGALEVLADVLKFNALHAGKVMHGEVSSVSVICMMTLLTIAFLATLWWLGAQTTRRMERSLLPLLPSVLIAVLAVAVVAMDFSIIWGLLLLCACPVSLIVIVVRNRNLKPERYAVR